MPPDGSDALWRESCNVRTAPATSCASTTMTVPASRSALRSPEPIPQPPMPAPNPPAPDETPLEIIELPPSQPSPRHSVDDPLPS